MNITRRGLFLGAAATLAAPAIAKAEILMPVRRLIVPKRQWIECVGQTLDRREYAELFAAIGHNYGGAGHKFKVPRLPQSGLRQMVATETIGGMVPPGSIYMFQAYQHD